MDSVAELGFRIDSGPMVTAEQALDRLAPAALRVQEASEAVARSAASATLKLRDEAAAIVADTQATLASVRSKMELQQSIIATTDSTRRAAAAKGAYNQLEEYAVRLEAKIAQQNRATATAQDEATQSVRRYMDARSKSNGMSAQYAAQYQKDLNSSLGLVMPNASKTASRGEDIAAYGQELDRLRTKFDPIFAVSKRYEGVLLEIDEAERLGAIQAHTAAAARDRETTAFQAATAAGGNYNKMSGQSRFQLQNLSYQLNDVISGLLMGQSPFQILTQQGGQFVQVMQMSGTGPIGLLKSVGAVLKSFITPARLAGAGIVGVGVAILSVAAMAVSNQKKMEQAIVGTGRASGVTASQLNDMASAAAASANIGLSSARSYAQGYASSGHLVGKQIQQLTELTENYAATTRQDGDDAAKELTGAFSDLGTGVDTLNKKVGFLNAAQREHILNLQAQGLYTKATQAAIDALKPSLVDYNTQLTEFGRIWHSISTFGSDMLGGAEAMMNPTTLQKLAEAKAQLENVKSQGGMAWVNGMPLYTAGAQAAVDRLAKQLKDEMGRAAKDAHDQFINNLSIRAADITGALNPAIAQIQNMINSRDTIKQAQSLGFPGMTPSQAAMATRSLEQVRGAVNSLADANGDLYVGGQRFLSQEQIRQKQDQLAIESANARTVADKARIAREQTRLSLIGQTISATDAANQVNAAGAVVAAQGARAIADQNAAMTFAVRSALALSQAYMRNDIPATLQLTAHYQALSDAISGTVDARLRERQLILQAVAEKVSSAAQDVSALRIQSKAQEDANKGVIAGTLGYERMSDFVQNRVRDAQLEQLRVAALSTGNKELIDTINGIIAAYKQLDAAKPANDNIAAVLGLANPNAAEIQQLRTAFQMRQQGQLTPEQLANVVGKSSIQSDVNQIGSDLGKSNPFGATGQMGLNSDIVNIKQQEAQRLQTIQDALQAGVIKSEQDAAARRIAINQDAAQQIQQAYTNLYSSQLQMGADAFGGMAESVGQLVGKSSAAYKALFLVSKAFSIAQATLNMEVAISNALALPWPANIPAIAAAAAAGASIISAIAAISQFRSGAVGIQGPGTGTSDSILARISRGESVVTASATSGNRNTIAAMNAGANFDGASGGGAKISIYNYGGSQVRARSVSMSEVEIYVDEQLKAASTAILKQTEKNVPNSVAKAKRAPRARSR